MGESFGVMSDCGQLGDIEYRSGDLEGINGSYTPEGPVHYFGLSTNHEQADKVDMEPVRMNPKHIRAQKDGKAPMEYLVWSVLEGDAHVHKGGADKYGVRNWRTDKILSSTYEGAIMRHFTAWASGQDTDPDSGFSHLYHIRCCCAILLDSEKHGTLIDDRHRVDSINERAE